ncbi:Protein of unknown function [Bryocella elongata]|uniref:DUF2946 domain-containing protein n=1 Tax=Bryocella elongata TaxID=863522 RepID=A0A1H5UEM9_9BACT|nr:DUF2946 family protein [Bryocella elongata]SEF73494.1 Protein of unknown function [Bryocella elongata]
MRHTVIVVTRKRSNPNTTPRVSQPLGLRKWLGVLAVFLGLMVQTAHTHSHRGDLGGLTHGKGHAVAAASQSNSDLCPLCVAMHSATPAITAGMPEPQETTSALIPAEYGRFVSRPPAYWHFSRPPPTFTR